MEIETGQIVAIPSNEPATELKRFLASLQLPA
jgi:hypothetical protein